MSEEKDWSSSLRGEWLLEGGITYLNHGAFGATPRRVLASAAAWREYAEKQPTRFLARELPDLVRFMVGEVAEFLGGNPQHMAFVENTTTGINAILRSLELSPGDRVLTTSLVYPAVRNVLRYVCDRAGARLKEIQLPYPVRSKEEILEKLDHALRPGARYALLDHVTSSTALVMPIQEMVELCHARKVEVIVDGAHAPGMVPLNLDRLGADYYVGNLHKWMFAPKGCAIIWAKEQHWRALQPAVISHVPEGPLAFDWPGTRDFSSWLAVHEALKFLKELGAEKVQRHNRELALWARKTLSQAWETELPAPPELIGSMACVQAPGPWKGTQSEADSLHDRLWEEVRVEVPVFPFADTLWVRISAQLYNERYHYLTLAEVLRP